ncbi:hypothetical protein MKZ38_006344 [Zalerion maritima]|uniref:Uncharacterized protein n=1 Tax=Zalerion maritima TaxID=339359 RepID=A0AAD5WTZ2_9PEZI|nr:hypothetical protein MKZ38_006344 [Zalerion maritima]
MMSSGSSSFTSSSRGAPPSYSSQRPNGLSSHSSSSGWAGYSGVSSPGVSALTSSVASPTFTPISEAPSTAPTTTSAGGQPLSTALDIGPPGWTATMDASGVSLHDARIEVKYEFSSYETSYQFQGDLRGKDLIDFFDVDCIYSDQHPRQNSYGAVAGLGAIQRIKLWKDRYGGYYSIAFFANRTNRRYHEHQTHLFDTDIRSVDDAHRRLRLYVRGRRGSAQSSRQASSRFNMPFHRSRQRSVGSSGSHSTEPEAALPFRYLGIQFTDDEDFGRFFDRWEEVHNESVDFNGVPFPQGPVELPGTQIYDVNAYEMEGDIAYEDTPTP